MGKHCILLSGSSAVRGYWGGGSARHWRAAAAPSGDRVCCRGSSAPNRRSGCRSRLPAWRRLPGDRRRMAHQPHDAQAGPEALLRVGPALQDQLAERGGSWADRSGLAANALDGPVGVPPMARRHVLGDGGVPMVTAGAQMSGNPLALQKDLDGSRRQSRLDLAACKAVGHAVEMTFELNVVIDTNPADAPFGKAIGLRRQRVEVGPVELFEERPAGDTEAPDRAFVVAVTHQLTDRGIEFGQTVEATVA